MDRQIAPISCDPESESAKQFQPDEFARIVADVESPSASRLQPEEIARKVYQQNKNSVVRVDKYAAGGKQFFGSGFVWNKNGAIVTCYHVTSDAQYCKVTFATGSSYHAEVLGFDKDKDIALLHVDAPEEMLMPILIGTSRDLFVGQTVYAIGNPKGFDGSLTTGMIRVINLAGCCVKNFIQTQGTLSPGNSGGPLFDSDGKLIGINTAMISNPRGCTGFGLSLHIDIVHPIVNQLIQSGNKSMDPPTEGTGVVIDA